MRGKIISYFDMCQNEGTSLQRGMNFRLHGKHSVILMSVHPNAPYQDQISEDGAVLVYEGHDEPKTSSNKEPKLEDQPEFLPSGNPTENGKFHRAALSYKRENKNPEIVRVYEKIKKGIWSDNGYFHLVDSWTESDEHRKVFKFKLVVVNENESEDALIDSNDIESIRSRVIPSSVKQAVWKRDKGKCTECGATDELHFDHIIPFSKGGASTKVENVQLLCARHNLQKSAKIQ